MRRLFRRSLFSVLFLIPLIAVLQVPVFIGGAALGTYLVYSRDLPKIPQLASYQPRTVSTFFADDGTVIGTFYKQKRFVVDLEQMPTHVVNAFLGAEDSRFYEHSGVYWPGIARAVLTNLKASMNGGRGVQGGSTITMQVTRHFLLTRERRISRKIKEMLLASELERIWGKKKILHVYLNEIYLGEGCYGVDAAARGYFGKPVEHLTVAEAALIAGLVASPARYNPFKSEKLARHRQVTVLQRMLRAGFITKEQYDQAKNETLVFRRETVRPFDLVPDFAEAVRRYIVSKYGEDKLYNEGLKVFTTCKIDFQQKALDAMTKGLNEIKARQKYLAILRTIPNEQISELLQGRKTPSLVEDNLYQGVVVKVVRGKPETDLQVALSKKVVGWVRVPPSEAMAYKVGHVLALRFDKFVDDAPFFRLDKDPKLQGALVLIENKTGYVRALVGGSSGEHFQFNRATQARRQPGSAFKPIIYSAAIEKKSYTPATIVVDEPVTVDLGARDDEEWEPKNAGGGFLGPVSVRTALELSRNICTVKILMDVGIDPVIELARKMGVTSPLGRNLSLSLGSSEMSLYEITSAYTVFPNAGVYVQPVLVKRIEDRLGNVLEDNTKLPVLDPSEMPQPIPRQEFRDLVGDAPLKDDETGLVKPKVAAPEKSPNPSPNKEGDECSQRGDVPRSRVRPALSAQTSYIITSMLQGGLVRGTGAGIRKILNRKDLAGKTGTTNNSTDTWFIGFNPEYTAGVWVGFDEKRPIGKREAGGRTALPIWGYLMKAVLEKVPEREFPVPPDIVFEEMTTYVGSPKQGFMPGTVTEPVYEPMIGLTLVMNPDDLKEYGTALISGSHAPAGGDPSSAFGGPYSQSLTPIYPQYQAPYPPPQSPEGGTVAPQPGVPRGQQAPGPYGYWGRSNQPPAYSGPPPVYLPDSSPGAQSPPRQGGPDQEQHSGASFPPQLPRFPDVEQEQDVQPYYPERVPR